MKKAVSIMMAIVMIFGMMPHFAVSAAYENTHINTGNQAYDIVEVAKTQIGYTEGSNNDTKYNRWLGSIPGYPSNGYGYAWCQSFVSWCAGQAGVPTSEILRKPGTVTVKQSFIDNGTYHKGPYEGGSYTPKKGDIIYFYSSATDSKHHVGIVSDCVNGTVYTIEGNKSNMVKECHYSVTYSAIRGYGVPNYSGTVVESLVTPTISTDKDSYTVGDTVNLSWTASPSNSNLSHYWLIIDAPDGSSFINETMNLNTSYSFTVTQAGNYSVTAFATPKGSLHGEGSLTHNVSITVNPQIWHHNLTPIDVGTDFYALIFNTNYWKALTVEADNNVDMRTEAISSSQVWKFVRQDDGSYVIYNGDKVLDSTGGNLSGNNVYTYEYYAGSDAQQWYIYGTSGAYYFRSKATDCVMDVCGNYSEEGTNIQMYTYHGGSAQQFQIWKVVSELIVEPGDEEHKTTFSWICNTAHSRSDVKIWKDELWTGDAYYIEWGGSTPFSYALPKGTYVAYVDTVIDDQPIMSNVVTFTVDEEYNPADINQDFKTTVLDAGPAKKSL